MPFEEINIENQEGGQVIHIPDRLKMDDKKVYLKKVGDILYVIPYDKPWRWLFDSLDEFSDDFMEGRDQGQVDQRENLR